MTYIVLSNNQMVRVPPGADPDYVRHIKENELIIATKPKRKRRSSTRCNRSRRQPSTATVFAQQQARAMVELVERVNEKGQDDDG
jgi:hypothetical protein